MLHIQRGHQGSTVYLGSGRHAPGRLRKVLKTGQCKNVERRQAERGGDIYKNIGGERYINRRKERKKERKKDIYIYNLVVAGSLSLSIPISPFILSPASIRHSWAIWIFSPAVIFKSFPMAKDHTLPRARGGMPAHTMSCTCVVCNWGCVKQIEITPKESTYDTTATLVRTHRIQAIQVFWEISYITKNDITAIMWGILRLHQPVFSLLSRSPYSFAVAFILPVWKDFINPDGLSCRHWLLLCVCVYVNVCMCVCVYVYVCCVCSVRE